MAIKLNTGKVAFPIEFDNGDKDCIYFNPNDPELMIRLTKFKDTIGEKMNAFDDVELGMDGNPEDESFIFVFAEMQKMFCDELDIAFGGEISKVVFKHCSPFAIVGGDYFIIQFVNAITHEIEKHIKKAKADVKKKMDKHLGKYAK
jgi:hypothetical protein